MKNYCDLYGGKFLEIENVGIITLCGISSIKSRSLDNQTRHLKIETKLNKTIFGTCYEYQFDEIICAWAKQRNK
jgi:hypothetical protein